MSLQITLDGQNEAFVRPQLAQGHLHSPKS
jgi:hypothetical protein